MEPASVQGRVDLNPVLFLASFLLYAASLLSTQATLPTARSHTLGNAA